jgi:hypothetical protein
MSATADLTSDSADGRKLLEQAMYRYKIAFDAVGRQTGATMRYANQHSVLWGAMSQGRFSTAFWLGVCAGLSIEWLKAAAKGEDFLNDLIKIRNVVFNPSKDNGAAAAFAGRVQGSHRAQNDVAGALKGVMNVDGKPGTTIYPYVTMTSAMKPGRYVYISTATHAMAARTGTSYFTASKVDFYDPNVGEMRGTSIDGIATYLKDAQEATMEALGRPVSDLTGKVVTVINLKKV